MNDIILARGNDFTIEALGDGIYAAIAVNGGHAICNSGLIDLGGQILVFDTFISPQAAASLKAFCVDHFGKPPQIVINSHYHNDHIWGNQVFADDALILSSSLTREQICTAGVEEFQWFTANSDQKLVDLQEKLLKTADEREKQELLLWIGEYSAVVESLPHLKVCPPEVTFPNSLEIHGNKRTAKLMSYENAHSASDTILYLPNDGILFMSDLLFVGMHPYLGDGEPSKLLDALREISMLNGRLYVPGHGIIGNRKDIDVLIEYIEHCCDIAEELLKAGDSIENSLSNVQMPAAFKHWMVSQFYRTNIRCTYDKLLQTIKN